MKSFSFLVVLMLTAAMRVNAQAEPDSAALAKKLRAVHFGTVLRVHAPAFGWTEGSFRRVDSMLVVGDVWSPKRISVREIDQIWVRSRSGAATGATIGAGAGILLAALFMGVVCSGPDEGCGASLVVPVVLVGSLVGALPGLVIGAGISGAGTWSAIYP